MAVAREPQLKLLERTLDDDDLAAQLDAWQDAKDALAAPRARFRQLDTQVKAALDELAEGEYRCGPYRIRVSRSDEKHVEFERTANKRIAIKRAAEEE